MEQYSKEFRGEVLAAFDAGKERRRLRCGLTFRSRGSAGSCSSVGRRARSRPRRLVRGCRSGMPGPIGCWPNWRHVRTLTCASCRLSLRRS